MKKSKYISLVLISAALASCDKQLTDTGDGDVYEQGKPNVYMRSDTTQDYTPVTANTDINYYGGNMWYYAFRPYYGYYNGGYYGYYGNNFFGWHNSFYHGGGHYYPGGGYHGGYGGYGGHRGNEGTAQHYGPHTTTGGFGHRSGSIGGGSATS